MSESVIHTIRGHGEPPPAKHFFITVTFPSPRWSGGVKKKLPAQYACTVLVKTEDPSGYFVDTEVRTKKVWDEEKEPLPKIMKDGPCITLVSVVRASESAIASWPYEIEIFPEPAED